MTAAGAVHAKEIPGAAAGGRQFRALCSGVSERDGSLGETVRRAITETSNPPPARTSLVAVDGRNRALSPNRRGSPTTVRVTFRSRAYSARAADAEGPSKVTV